jgi:hypothetical protein
MTFKLDARQNLLEAAAAAIVLRSIWLRLERLRAIDHQQKETP